MRLNNGGPSVVVVQGHQFCLIQYGGHKTKSLHCEMKSLHVLSKHAAHPSGVLPSGRATNINKAPNAQKSMPRRTGLLTWLENFIFVQKVYAC